MDNTDFFVVPSNGEKWNEKSQWVPSLKGLGELYDLKT